MTRTDFERDADRILYSPQFHRLTGVTQVTLAHDSIRAHNRFTHSVKVANIARRIVGHLVRSHPDLARVEIDSSVVEAAALAHDIGHPPFGHVGEQQLCDLVESAVGVEDGFEHNAQTFRILTQLAAHPLASAGLGLTRATLRAALKYPYLKARDDEKYGAYQEDRGAFEWVMDPDGAGVRRKSVEADIMDWADDITYAVHDIEDFYRAGMIPLGHLIARATLQQVTRRYRSIVDEAGIPIELDNAERVRLGSEIEALRRLVMTTPPTEGALEPALEYELVLFADLGVTERASGRFVDSLDINKGLALWRSQRVREFISATYLEVENDRAAFKVRDSLGDGDESDAPTIQQRVAALKLLTRRHVHREAALQTQQMGVKAVLQNLFDRYCTRVIHGDGFNPEEAQGIINLVPPWVARQLNDAKASNADIKAKRRLWARAIADYVASLTDQQAIDLSQRISGVSLGSIADSL